MRAGDHEAMSSRAIDGGTPQGHAGQVAWPVLSGLIPPLADSYTQRAETGLSLAGSLNPGETTVLVSSDEAARALGGLGGTGKTQLAAGVAHTLWDQRAVDLLVWVTASGRDAVVTGYAQTLASVGAADPGGGPEKAALHFLAWLAAAEAGGPRWLRAVRATAVRRAVRSDRSILCRCRVSQFRCRPRSDCPVLFSQACGLLPPRCRPASPRKCARRTVREQHPHLPGEVVKTIAKQVRRRRGDGQAAGQAKGHLWGSG